MKTFGEVLGTCVASWNVLKEFARSRGESIIEALDSKWADASKILTLAKSVAPYPYQEEVRHKLADLSVDGGLLVVEAPTAAGKTEAIATAFLEQLVRDDWWLAPRFVYTLPTKALTLSTYARLRAYARGVSLLADVPELTVAFEYGSTLGAKHYLYGGVVTAATLDAAIYGYAAVRFPGRTTGNPRVSMPVGLLTTSLLVLDEVQLYQDTHYYSPRVLGAVLTPLVEAGCVVVILTATLPTVLLDIMASGIGYERVEASGSARGSVEVSLAPLQKRESILEYLLGEGRDKLMEVLKSGRHVLVVVNTVPRAVAVYEKLKSLFGESVILLHGRLANRDRESRESALFSSSYIVVSTQVVEAGFDLDAGLLVTELAPPDSLIQRIGRVARKPGTNGEAIIVDLPDGETAPYPEKVMNLTREVVTEERLERALVSVKYARELLDEVYKREVVEELSRKAGRQLASAYSYIKRLRLFSLPPEEDFSFREGTYLTVVVPEVVISVEGVPEKVASLIMEVARGDRKSGELEIDSVEEALRLAEAVDKASINVGYVHAERLVSQIAAIISISGSRLALIPLREGSATLRPLATYLLSAGVYDQEKGLSLVKQESESRGRRRRRRRRGGRR